MSSKFFNNNNENTLFNKLKGIALEMSNFDKFLAVVAYFRSSGYFKLRKELDNVSQIKILVGINVDEIFRKHNKALLFLADESSAKEIYCKDFKEDIVSAQYGSETEDGIIQMCEDLISGKLQMRIHATKNLHAKFYLCLPKEHTPNTDGWIIMGSSNISDSGLGISKAPRYELNVAMKDYDDVNFCHEEFKMLWDEALPLTIEDIELCKKNTYLGYQPTPYELYMKVLIDTFGDQIEDDISIDLPENVKDLKYQKDAAIQGYQMLVKHNGLFLADVVGLGKTIVATMIAKRFIEENGKNTNVLVILPPALKDAWEKAFKDFGIKKKAQFITNGSLSKILEGKEQYKDKEEFDLIIIDEAHGFRNDYSRKYEELEKICKSPCTKDGQLKSLNKKIMLLSATPLNNRPEDLLNQLLLFQDNDSSTIDGISNLKTFFNPLISEYKKLMKERDKKDVTNDVDKIYKKIRDKVIDKVTIRRTRSNINNDEAYKEDLVSQKIKFPEPTSPKELQYKLDKQTNELFYETISVLSDDSRLSYARYRAIEYLNDEFHGKYKDAKHTSQILAGIYRVHMVKRLESSFYAFKKSLKNLLKRTQNMIEMFKNDNVLIIPDLDVNKFIEKGLELDQIIEKALEKGYLEKDISYKSTDFKSEFLEMLKKDEAELIKLDKKWKKINSDPKFDVFKENLNNEWMKKEINHSGKLVVFSESVDTLTYLNECLKKLNRDDVLMITSSNAKKNRENIKENFDANNEIKKDNYNIIITSDVLAEGVNLHRSNIIVNYDSPWNATRLMQRIGRVNRIGSVSDKIYNYMFYPSNQGEKEINLYKSALVKLQGFHSAFGEDAQIFSKEEIVKQFNLYDNNVKDSVDERLKLLSEVRLLFNTKRDLYDKIKNLPLKSRAIRNKEKYKNRSIVFVSSNFKTEFYIVENDTVKSIDFLEAAKYLYAIPEEKPAEFTNKELHYKHVNLAIKKYENEYIEAKDDSSLKNQSTDKNSLLLYKFLRNIKRIFPNNSILKEDCNKLEICINKGYAGLSRDLKKLEKKYKNRAFNNEDEICKEIKNLVKEFSKDNQNNKSKDISNPQIIISETFN